MVKADLHVHSKFSADPTNWLGKRFRAWDSLTEPRHVYDTAREKGMTHVTITDHNVIAGCLEIMDLPGTFVSCEITAKFPEDLCKVHVLVYDINEAQYRDLMHLRNDVYELVQHCDRNGIFYALAHPFYPVNNKLTQEIFEKLLLLFNLFELNGSRSKEASDGLMTLLAGLSREKLEGLAKFHRLENPKIDPEKKHFVCGSDDHSGHFTAGSFTANPSGDISGLFAEAGENQITLNSSEPRDLAYVIYSVGYQNFGRRLDVERAVPYEAAIQNIHTLLTMKERTPSSLHHSVARLIMKKRPTHRSDARFVLRDRLRRISTATEGLTPENAPSRWFETVSEVTNESLRALLDYIEEEFGKRDVFDIFRAIGSISFLYFLLTPYYVSYRLFTDTRRFAESVRFGDLPDKGLKVGNFTDTFYEVNGVATTLQQAALIAKELGLDYQCIVCSDGESLFGEKVFKHIAVYSLQEYPEQKLFIPPILEILDYCYKEDFTHIHAATPGPLGLVGLIAAKLLRRPFYATHHTAIPQYAGLITDQALIEDLGWTYLSWFYGAASRVLVPSLAFKQDLVDHGIDESKIILMPGGIDTERFRPKSWEHGDGGFNLLYVGRISKEKNLDILAEAFKLLNRPDVSLTIVGDGAYRRELEEKLRGFNVRFLGYLEGEDLTKAYHDSDLFVFPSTTDTFGNVVLEAHACALPTVVTDKGGPGENVSDGETGIVVPGDNVYALRSGIASLLDKNKLREMGERARVRVEDRTSRKQFERLWSIYE